MTGNVRRQHEICFSWLLQQPLLVRKQSLIFPAGISSRIRRCMSLDIHSPYLPSVYPSILLRAQSTLVLTLSVRLERCHGLPLLNCFGRFLDAAQSPGKRSKAPGSGLWPHRHKYRPDGSTDTGFRTIHFWACPKAMLSGGSSQLLTPPPLLSWFSPSPKLDYVRTENANSYIWSKEQRKLKKTI